MPIDQIAIANHAADKLQAYIDAGVSRASDPAQIDRFLLYSCGEADPALAYCISACCYVYGVAYLDQQGISYTPETVDSVLIAHKQAIQAALFPVSASVTDFINRAGARFTPVSQIPQNLTIPRGSLVCYEWKAATDTTPAERHAELYDCDMPGTGGDTFRTLGPNTGQGQILNRVRGWEFVLGMFIPEVGGDA